MLCLVPTQTGKIQIMKIGIIGLPYVGKTSIFNALTGAEAEIGSYTSGTKTNIRSVTVPDERLNVLTEVFHAQEVTPTTIEYIDIVGMSKGDINRGSFEASLIADLREVDALAHVVRFFKDDTVPHVDGDVNPKRDIETIDLELTFADLQIIDRRLERLEKELRTKRDRILEHQQNVLKTCKNALENGIAIRELEITNEDEKTIRGYQFLTQKPMLTICNIGEDQINQSDQIINYHIEHHTKKFSTEIFVLSAKLEMEIAQLDSTEANIFLEEMGLQESALNRFIQMSYQLLGLITFFTCTGMDELRAWTIQCGTTAVEAAGLIHTDMAQGFIRAETIHWSELVEVKSLIKAKEKGLLRLEGKDYLVQDGDILTIRFNV